MSIDNVSTWTESLKAMTVNVQAKYRELRRDEITGISRANLRQIVSTRGVNVPPGKFDRLLDQAIEHAEFPTGFIYN